jgi:RNA polymerase sigma-70 factor (ECF subfamily)
MPQGIGELLDNNAVNVLEAVYHSDSRKLYSRLVRALNDFDAAEDALQDAVIEAARQWPEHGVPDNPAGWLYKVAKFRGIDHLRRKRRLAPLAEYEAVTSDYYQEIGDELLRLVFTCCHPAISPDAQIALTLREVCELTTEEIARAFLTPVPTIAQRIVRAKSKIREARIPFEVPAKEDLPDRLNPVLKTIYLVFNEGYSSSSGENLMRPDLMSLAIHLARQLLDLLPEPETMGVLALMLLHKARSSTRIDPQGDIVLIQDQDRSLWDRGLISQAGELVAHALRSGRFGPYTLQAAIAALHAEAPSFTETDWGEIVGLYDLLVSIERSPVAELNRAVAVAMRDGIPAGIVLIDQLVSAGELQNYHLTYAARAALYFRSGDFSKARVDYLSALEHANQEPERRRIQRCLDGIP